MYLDFGPKKLGDELGGKAMVEADKAVSQVGPRDPLGCWGSGEDGGSGTVSAHGVVMRAEAGERVTPT
jgi:hypothetical protein